MERTRFIITTGVLAILFTISVLVVWNVIFTKYYLLATETDFAELGVGFWLILSFGDVFLALVISALVVFIVSNLRAARHLWQQETFIDSVTHELKSPLASIQLCLDTLRMQQVTPEEQARFIAMMADDVDRLTGFIEHVLEAGRLEPELSDLLMEPFDVGALARRCCARVERKYRLAEGALALELTGDCERVRMHRLALETILFNLLDNAVKYSFDEVVVSCRVSRSPSLLTLEVADQGIGIAHEQQQRVFNRFFRISPSGPRKVRGTGLGLYVVDLLVRRLGGSIVVESEGEGSGSSFRVELPLLTKPLEVGP